MQRQSISFESLVQTVSKNNLFSKIYIKQSQIYDLMPYKIQQIKTQTILTIYTIIKQKYKNGIQNIHDQWGWNENQRKTFVWFIVCYNYLFNHENHKISQKQWNSLSTIFFNKRPQFLQFQFLSLLKNKHRIEWNQSQDQLLTKAVQIQSPGKWNQISKRLFFTSQRKIFKSPKHCRQRWLNHLDKSKVKGQWTNQQNVKILKFVLKNGKKWSKMIDLLLGKRTQHMIKNRFNSLISKSRINKKQRQQDIIQKLITKYENKSFQPQYQAMQMIIQSDSLKQQMQKSTSITRYPQIPSPIFTSNHQCFFNFYQNCNLYYINCVYPFQIAQPFLQKTGQNYSSLIFSKNSSFKVFNQSQQFIS